MSFADIDKKTYELIKEEEVKKGRKVALSKVFLPRKGLSGQVVRLTAFLQMRST